MPDARPACRRKRPQRTAERATCRCPPRTMHGIMDRATPHARNGHLSPPHDVQTTQGLPRAREPRVRDRLVGLGRLERPTSRLSGVRSNQLSYRPESHPFDRRCEAATRDGRGHAHPPGGRSHASGGDHGCAKGRADGGGPLCSRRCVNIAAWAAPRAEARSTGPKGAP